LRQRRPWTSWLILLVLLVLSGRAISQYRQQRREETRIYYQFLDDVAQGKVDLIKVGVGGRLLYRLQGDDDKTCLLYTSRCV